MTKHFFWGLVVIVVSVLAAYVGLVVSGHSEEATALGGGAIFCLFLVFVCGFLF